MPSTLSRLIAYLAVNEMHYVEYLAHSLNHSQVANIFSSTPTNVPFSNAAATLSLSPSCLLTAVSVLCVPSLTLTSTRKRGGSACSKRTRTPRPMTVARLQWVIVGVISTRTVEKGEEVEDGVVMWMSESWTTLREPRERGCSGSEMGAIRSVVGALVVSRRDMLAMW